MEKHENITTQTRPEISRANIWKRRLATGLAVSVATGGGVVAVENDVHEKLPSIDEIGDIGLTPSPDISSAGTEALIAANDVVRDVGPVVPVAAMALAGGLYARRRFSHKLDGSFDYVNATKGSKNSWSPLNPRIALPALIIGATASASALGDVAGKGANAPIAEFLAPGYESEKNSDTSVLVPHQRWTPFNYSSIDKEDAEELSGRIRVSSPDGEIVPFTLALDDVYSKEASTNPSSAPIVAVPNEALNARGYDFANEVEGCSDTEVLVGEQLGAKPGDSVMVMGREVEVAGTVDILPGLDRVFVAGSTEQLSECGLSGDSYSGIFVEGMSPQELQIQIDGLGQDYSAVSLDKLTENYTDFWDRSVKPVEMQLAALVLLLGAASVMYVRKNNVILQKGEIAALNSLGVTKKQILKAENLRTVLDGTKAAVYSAGVLYALDHLAASSQYGLELPADVESLGAGMAMFGAVAVASTVSAKKAVKNINISQEIRS